MACGHALNAAVTPDWLAAPPTVSTTGTFALAAPFRSEHDRSDVIESHCMLQGRLGVLAVLTAALAVPKAADQSFQIVLDYSGAPQMAEYGRRAKALAEEWYPKIDVILFGPNHPFIHRKITIIIDSAAPKQVQFNGRPGAVVASSSNGVIRLHTEWLATNPEAFEQVFVHELTHVNEDNHAQRIERCQGIHRLPCLVQMHLSRPNREMGWLTDSICDYVAYAVFSRKLDPRLRLDEAGHLTGYDQSSPYLYGLERARIPLLKRGYRHSYTVGASFLLWLAQMKDSDIVRKLNVAMTRQRCSPHLLQQYTGASLDQLWREFTRQSQEHGSRPGAGVPASQRLLPGNWNSAAVLSQ